MSIGYLLVHDVDRGVTHYLGYNSGVGWRLLCARSGNGVCGSCITDAPKLPLCLACHASEIGGREPPICGPGHQAADPVHQPTRS